MNINNLKTQKDPKDPLDKIEDKIERQKISNQKSRLVFLDLLRFIASIFVFFYHIYDKNPENHGFLIFDIKKDFFNTGIVGVIIFFLISGYIIPYAIARCRNIKDFLIKRCIRIYPLLIIVMVYGLARYGGFEEKMILGLLLPIADFLIEGIWIAKGVDWTLRVEFFYYVLIAIIYFKNKFNFKTIFLSILATSTLAIITLIYREENFNNGLVHLNFIFLGSLLYLIEKENFQNSSNNSYAIIAFILSIMSFEICRFDNSLGILFGTAVFLFFYFLHQTKLRIKPNKFIECLGEISYPLYLLHIMIYEDLYWLFNSHIITPIIFVVICYAVHLLIEKPSMKYLKNIFTNP